MLHVLTKKEIKEHEKELIKFCKEPENSWLMFNYMRTIKNLRSTNNDVDKIIDLINSKIRHREQTMRGFKKNQVTLKQKRSLNKVHVSIKSLMNLKKDICKILKR